MTCHVSPCELLTYFVYYALQDMSPISAGSNGIETIFQVIVYTLIKHIIDICRCNSRYHVKMDLISQPFFIRLLLLMTAYQLFIPSCMRKNIIVFENYHFGGEAHTPPLKYLDSMDPSRQKKTSFHQWKN